MSFKRRQAGYTRPTDYDGSTILEKATCSWAGPLLTKGHKDRLEVCDAEPLLSEQDTVDQLVASYKRYYSIEEEQQDARARAAHVASSAPKADQRPAEGRAQHAPRYQRNGFFNALMRAHVFHMAHHSFWALAEICFRLLSPVALRFFIQFLERYEDPEIKTSEGEGWGWAIGIMLFGLGLTLSHHQLFWVGMRMGFHMKQQAIAAVQEKLLRLNGATLGNLSSGQIVNLVSNDVRRFDDFGPFWVFLWASPLETMLVLLLAALEIGFLPAFAGVATLLLVVPLNALLARQISALRLATAKQTDERVRLTGELLDGATSVKMLTWEQPFIRFVGRIRAAEVVPMWRMLMINGGCLALMYCCVPVACLVTFSVAVYGNGDELSVDSVFYVVALLHLPKLWLALFFVKGVKSASETRVAMRRINDFLTELEASTPVDAAAQALAPGTVEMRGADFSWASRAWAGAADLSMPAPAASGAASPRRRGAFAGASRTLRTVVSLGKLQDAEKDDATSERVANTEAVSRRTLTSPQFTIAPGSLVAICGEVGCGKSSLLSALLGELQPVPPEGYIVGEAIPGAPRIAGRVAYCQQIPWIEAGSVKDNIVFGAEYDARLYDTVVHACALVHDIASLPAGDDTEIGERGINLSGGQKARLALARAAYRRADVCLLDDPLSAVDPRVARHLFTQCIGHDGVMAGATRVLVTHQTQWLHACDRVLVMRSGAIVADGTWTELSGRDDLTELHARHDGEVADATFDDPIPEAPVSTHARSAHRADSSGSAERLSASSEDGAARKASVRRPREGGPLGEAATAQHKVEGGVGSTSTSHSELSRSSGHRPVGELLDEDSKQLAAGHAGASDGYTHAADSSIDYHDGAPAKLRDNGGTASGSDAVGSNSHERISAEKGPAPSKDGTLTKDEHRETGHVSRTVWWRYVVALGSWQFTLIVLALLAGQICWILSEWWLSEWASEPFANQQDLRWVGVYTGLVALVVVFSLLRNFGFFTLALRAGTTLNKRMLNSVLHAPLSFYHTNPTGRVLNVFSKDQGSVDEQLPEVMFDAMQTVSVVVGAFILIAIANPAVIPVFLPLAWAFHYVRGYYLESSREVKRFEAVTRSPVYAQFSATLRGLPTIRAYGVADRFRASFTSALNCNGSWWVAFLSTARWVGFRMDVISWVLLSAAVILTMCFKSLVSASLLALALTQTLQLSGVMQWAVRQTAEAENYMTSVERILGYCALPQERATVKEGAPAPPSGWPSSATLQCDRVTARYRQGLAPVLKDLSFKVASGTTCGLVGRTGSGKSSLLLTLFDLINIDSGRVLLDGVDVRSIGLDALRHQIAVIPQDPVLFSGSLRANLDPWAQVSDLDVWQVLEQVQLKGKVQELGGLDAVMAEAGTNLSAGQRQLICLARALLTDSRILALDEATANVDRSTDAIIQGALHDAVKGPNATTERIMLVIAHRVGTIMDCDHLLVLADGQLVEQGRPRDLAEGSGLFGQLTAAAAASEKREK